MYVRNSPIKLMGLSESIKKLPPAPPGYIWVYEADGLSGIGKLSLKKVFKSVAKIAIAPIKAVAKVSKKIAVSPIGRVALLGAAAWYAAPWFATLAKSVGTIAAKAIVGQKASQVLTADEAARAENEISSNVLPDWVASAANSFISIEQQKKMAQQEAEANNQRVIMERQSALREAQKQALYNQGGAGYVEGSYTGEGYPTKEETPAWLIPAAIGGAALLLLSAQ